MTLPARYNAAQQSVYSRHSIDRIRPDAAHHGRLRPDVDGVAADIDVLLLIACRTWKA